MKRSPVLLVRLYLSEKEGIRPLLDYLHDRSGVRGVTVFRGIAGFGPSGKLHGASLLDLSLDLPLVVEFFDTPDRIKPVVEHLRTLVDPHHIVVWSAATCTDDEGE